MRQKLIWMLAGAILLASPCCGRNGESGTGTASGAKGARELSKPRENIPGLSNFAKVSDHLFRGAQPTKEGFAELKKMGIRTIVNLRAFHSDRELLQGLGLKYVNIPFKPWHPEEEDIVQFLKVVTDPGSQPVFVHCQHGADRTGTMVVVYRIVVQGWGLKDAMEELPIFGFHETWSNLRDYLSGLDAKAMLEKVKAEPAPEIETVP